MGVGADVPMVSTEGLEVSEVDEEERAGIVERTRSCFRCGVRMRVVESAPKFELGHFLIEFNNKND